MLREESIDMRAIFFAQEKRLRPTVTFWRSRQPWPWMKSVTDEVFHETQNDLEQSSTVLYKE